MTSTADRADAAPGDHVCDDGTGHCTLRAAIQTADLDPGADTINLGAATYTLSLADASGTEDTSGATGDLLVAHDLTVTGVGAGQTTIDGGGIDRVLDVQAGAHLTISGVTIQHGVAPATGVADTKAFDGGGIRVYGVLTMSDATLTANRLGSPDGYGAGLATDADGAMATLDHVAITDNGQAGVGSCGGVAQDAGTITITASTIAGNQSGWGGAGCEQRVYTTTSLPAGSISVSDSAVTGNSASTTSTTGETGGGGFVEDGGGTITITRTTMSGNAAQFGGALLADGGGTITVTDSTLSRNHARAVAANMRDDGENGSGGAFGQDSPGHIRIIRSTLSGNTADLSGGAIYSYGYGSTHDFTISNSTITGNSAAAGGGALRLDGVDTIAITNSTIDANSAGTGGQIGICDAAPLTEACTPQISFADTVVAAGTPVNCSAPATATISSSGSNLDSGSSCGFTAAGDLSNTDPLLAPLADNAGLTQTQALQFGSPALGGVRAGCPPPATDQRGSRVRSGRCVTSVRSRPRPGAARQRRSPASHPHPRPVRQRSAPRR